MHLRLLEQKSVPLVADRGVGEMGHAIVRQVLAICLERLVVTVLECMVEGLECGIDLVAASSTFWL